MADFRWTVLALAAVLVTSCNALKENPEIDAQARSAFEQARRHDTNDFAARLDPTLRTSETIANLNAVERLIPDKDPIDRKNIGSNTVVSGDDTTVFITDQYNYGDRFALINTQFHRKSGEKDWKIQGFHVQIATAKELSANNFTLSGKSITQYAFLGLAIISPIIMFVAFVKILITKNLKRKWLWCIISFFGLFSLKMNWTTGAIAYQILWVGILNAGYFRGLSPFSPWIIICTFPVGALLILFGVWGTPRRKYNPREFLTNRPLQLGSDD